MHGEKERSKVVRFMVFGGRQIYLRVAKIDP
jgi:hypothetical protein